MNRWNQRGEQGASHRGYGGSDRSPRRSHAVLRVLCGRVFGWLFCRESVDSVLNVLVFRWLLHDSWALRVASLMLLATASLGPVRRATTQKLGQTEKILAKELCGVLISRACASGER